jgi:hypothetical protein
MTGSSVAGIITAVGVCITAIGGLVATIGVFIPILRQTKATHKIVNQQHTDMVRYQAALVKALTAAGIAVPEDQSLPPSNP